jgi:hypothetical protein
MAIAEVKFSGEIGSACEAAAHRDVCREGITRTYGASIACCKGIQQEN